MGFLDQLLGVPELLMSPGGWLRMALSKGQDPITRTYLETAPERRAIGMAVLGAGAAGVGPAASPGAAAAPVAPQSGDRITSAFLGGQQPVRFTVPTDIGTNLFYPEDQKYTLPDRSTGKSSKGTDLWGMTKDELKKQLVQSVVGSLFGGGQQTQAPQYQPPQFSHSNRNYMLTR